MSSRIPKSRRSARASNELVSKAGKTKRTVTPLEEDKGYLDALTAQVGDKLKDALDTEKHPKFESYALVKQIKDELKKQLPEGDAAAGKKLSKYFEKLRENIFRDQVLTERIRPDHRAFDKIRQISIETGVLPRVHGSALFTRGETQALVSCTLGTTDDAQRMESYEGEQKRKFMLHYNFPPFSVGEVGRMTGVGRREIGHGALAWRAIEAVLPAEDESPYTLRVVSDILESNGSSSMATVCGASLALMSAGIQLKGAVAGVAMGLVKEGDNYAILSDIAGAEDHYGDMDFKVAGTREGITALQMDIKIMGITTQIMREAMEQARQGRMFLLDTMDAVISKASEEKSAFAPRIHTIQIPTDKIRDLIGPGGKVIRGIVDATGVKIDVNDSGIVNVASSDADGLAKAIQMISDITAVPEIGKTYLGKVVRLAEFGAFVEIFPGTDGLLHVSEIAEHRVKEVKDELRDGDMILVKVLSMEGNRVKLSRKAVLREQREKLGLPPVADEGGGDRDRGPRPERGSGDRDRGGRGGDRERGGSSGSSDRGPRPERTERPEAPKHEATVVVEGGEDFDDDDFDGDDGADDSVEENGATQSTGDAAPAGRRQGPRRPTSRTPPSWRTSSRRSRRRWLRPAGWRFGQLVLA